MMFSFLPALSRGSGLSTGTLANLLAARDLTGLLGPAAGGVVRRVGPWRTMVAAGALAAVGMLLIPLGPLGVVVGLIFWGICRTGFLVSLNSWIGEIVAYERRGRVTGMIELTWAGAALIGLPLMGLLIDRVGWWAAPTVLGALGLPLAVAMGLVATDRPDLADGPAQVATRIGRNANTALAGFALLTAAAQFLLITHGSWLEDTYGFDPAQVGFAIIAVGAAEAVASYGTARVSDALGKRNSVVAGTAILGVALVLFALMPAPGLVIGLGLLVVAFLGFEFAIVSSIAMVAELEPTARAAGVGRSVAMSTTARAAISALGAWIYATSGFRTAMICGAVAAVAAVVVLTLAVDEPGDPAT